MLLLMFAWWCSVAAPGVCLVVLAIGLCVDIGGSGFGVDLTGSGSCSGFGLCVYLDLGLFGTVELKQKIIIEPFYFS